MSNKPILLAIYHLLYKPNIFDMDNERKCTFNEYNLKSINELLNINKNI
jgi:hypothetical protein